MAGEEKRHGGKIDVGEKQRSREKMRWKNEQCEWLVEKGGGSITSCQGGLQLWRDRDAECEFNEV